MNKDLPKELPDDVGIIQVDVIGAVTKKRFLGEFKCRIPTMEDQSSMARFEASLNGDNAPFLAQGILKINKMIAYLKYTLVDIPIFWKDSNFGHRLRDPNVIEEVYNQVIMFEDSWLKQIWGDGKEDGKEESGSPKEGSEEKGI